MTDEEYQNHVDYGPEPDFEDGGEWQMECPFCDGDGQTTTAFEADGRITMDCPECGGTGWY